MTQDNFDAKITFSNIRASLSNLKIDIVLLLERDQLITVRHLYKKDGLY